MSQKYPRKRFTMLQKKLYKKTLLKYSTCLLAMGAFVTMYAHQTRAAVAADYFDLSPEQLLNATVISATKTNETVEKTRRISRDQA